MRARFWTSVWDCCWDKGQLGMLHNQWMRRWRCDREWETEFAFSMFGGNCTAVILRGYDQLRGKAKGRKKVKRWSLGVQRCIASTRRSKGRSVSFSLKGRRFDRALWVLWFLFGRHEWYPVGFDIWGLSDLAFRFVFFHLLHWTCINCMASKLVYSIAKANEILQHKSH